MAHPKAAWGIEIGANAIKAIRLERDGSDVTVSDFAVINHKKVLTTPDLDQDEMIRLSLGQFISQKSLEGEHMVMSVPGHSAFARFAKLPPVEPKKIPDIVKFEAVQQIPFPIDKVEWDYQTFTSDDSPEVEVGIFAITRERVQQRLGLYGELGVTPESLTLSPVALYNAMAFDHGLQDAKGPVVFLDIGTQATDVVVAEAGRCWIRTFPLGGTHFTDAIASAFKLSYSKAEKLKREAATSKYAKQIMQAMRPVFSDLLQDLQRSIGYYNSLRRDQELTNMVGLGSTFKIPGLRKFLGQQLQINVVRLDEFKRVGVTGREAASFAENTVNMATAYGLALQGVGLAEISANLVPVKALRDQMWHSKTKWFAAAAAIVIAGAAMTLYRPLTDRAALPAGDGPQVVNEVITNGKRLKAEYTQLSAEVGHTAKNVMRLFDDRSVWGYLLQDVAAALHSTEPQAELLSGDQQKILGIDPLQRRLVQLEQLNIGYEPPATKKNPRVLYVTMNVQVSHEDSKEFLNQTIEQWLRDNADPTGDRADVPYRILPDSISHNPTSWERREVTASGEEVVGGGGSPSGAGRGGDRAGVPTGRPATPAKGRRPKGRAPGPAGAGGGGGMGASGGGGMGASGGGAARGPTRPKAPRRKAPGSGLGGGGGGAMGAGGGGGGQPGTQRPSQPTAPKLPGGLRPPDLPGVGSPADRGAVAIDVNAVAPLPQKPALYPKGTVYHMVPITFEIELLDPSKLPASRQTAARDDQREDDAS